MFMLRFDNCEVIIWPTQERMVTIFSDGAELPAAPNYDDESIARAVSLGYGTNVWAMTLDHELLHTHLAESRGWPYSPALWVAAHEGDPWPEFATMSWQEEEAEVLRVQAAINFRKKVQCTLESW